MQDLFKAIDLLDSSDLDSIKLGRLMLESIYEIAYPLLDWYLIFARDHKNNHLEYLPFSNVINYFPSKPKRSVFRIKDCLCHRVEYSYTEYDLHQKFLEDLSMPF